MTSDAQNKASERYRREKMVQRVIRFSPNERELLEHLESKPNRMGYLKGLIRQDMAGRSIRTAAEILENWEKERSTDWYAVDEIAVDGRRIRLLVADAYRAKRFAAERVAGVHLVDHEGNPCEPGELGDEPFYRCQLIGSDEAKAYFEGCSASGR